MNEIQTNVSTLFKSMSMMSIVYGIILIIISMFLFTNTEQAYILVTTLLGVYLLVRGLIDFVVVFDTTHEHRGTELFMSVIYIIAGFIAVMHPLLATTFLATFIVYIIGFSFIIGGFLTCKISVPMALLNIVLGVLMLFYTQIFAYGFVWVIALVILLSGVFTITFGAIVNGVAHTIDAIE